MSVDHRPNSIGDQLKKFEKNARELTLSCRPGSQKDGEAAFRNKCHKKAGRRGTEEGDIPYQRSPPKPKNKTA